MTMLLTTAQRLIMLNKIKKFLTLDGQQKKLFLQAYFLLGVMRAAILTVSFKRLSKSLQHHPEEAPHKPLDTAQLEQAKTIGRAVVTAARYTPWDSNCLAQVLTAQRMLEQKHIAGMFFLGVKKDEQKLGAHAWLQVDGQILTGESGHQNFTVVSTFSW